MAWNRPTSNTGNATSSSRPSGRGKMPRLRRGLIAGVIVVLGAGLAAWLLMTGEATSSSLQKKDRGLIKEVKPAIASKTEEARKPVNPREDYDHKKFYRDKDGVLRFINGDGKAPDPTRKVIKAVDYYDTSKSIFHYSSERSIYNLIAARPGGKMWGRKDFHDKYFLENFKESLKEPIIISHDDSERVQRAKKAMIEVKKEICDRMRAGESLGDILTAARSEIQRLNEYKRNLEREIGDFIKKDGGVAEQDLNDYITAANMMLEKEGVRPVDKDMFTEWNVRLNAARDKAQSDSTQAKPPSGEL